MKVLLKAVYVYYDVPLTSEKNVLPDKYLVKIYCIRWVSVVDLSINNFRWCINFKSFLVKFAFKICWSLNSLYSVNLFQKKTLNKAELLTQFHGFAGNLEFLSLLDNFAILFPYPGQLSVWMEIFLPLHKRSDLWLPNRLIIGAFLPVILCGSVITTVVSNVFLAAQDAEHNTSTPAHQ